MDWLKDKYKEIMINGLISALCVLIGFWAYGFRDASNSADERFIKLEREKANIAYVNEHCFDLSERIDEKADKSLVESMDHKLDLILRELK